MEHRADLEAVLDQNRPIQRKSRAKGKLLKTWIVSNQLVQVV